MYINSINLYRGIAIIFIVSAHCYSISNVKIDTVWESIFANLTAGSTIHFIFISGFLFHHIFYRKNKTSTFFLAKVKRLLVPYIWLSIVPIFLKLRLEPDFWRTVLDIQGKGVFYDYILPVVLYYSTGAHLVAYWYIPFAMLLFACYPLHIAFINAKSKHQLWILVLWFTVAALIHRPVDELNVFQSLVYFMPTYLLGIWCSMHKNRIYALFRRKEWILGIIVLGMAFVQALLGDFDNYQKPAFVYDGIDLILLQKSIFCIFFMVFLYRFEQSNMRILNLLAETSFAIYFLHGYILQLLHVLKANFNSMIGFPWITYFTILVLLIGTSMIIAICIKKILPNYSKYITGY